MAMNPYAAPLELTPTIGRVAVTMISLRRSWSGRGRSPCCFVVSEHLFAMPRQELQSSQSSRDGALLDNPTCEQMLRI